MDWPRKFGFGLRMRALLSPHDRWHLGQILVFWTTPYRDSEVNSDLRVRLSVMMTRGRNSLIKGRTWRKRKSGLGGAGGGGGAVPATVAG